MAIPQRKPDPDEARPPSGSGGWLLLAAIAVVGALLGWLFSEYGDQFDWDTDGPRLGYALLLMVLVISSLALRRRQIGGALKSLLAWALIFVVVLIAYSYRTELKAVWYRVAGEIDTSRATPVEPRGPARDDRDSGRDTERSEGRALAIRVSSDGHYHVSAAINGAEMRLLVDTGATVTVLSVRNAERAGIFPNPGDYTVNVRTASGMSKAAPIRIREMRIGAARLDDVQALVMHTPGDISVLGIGTLQRFKSYEVRDGVLTLRW